MRFKKYLQEELVIGIKLLSMGTGKKKYAEVFVNPTKKELNSLHDDFELIRFLYDIKANKFYVWGGVFYHQDVLKKILSSGGYEFAKKNSHELFIGIGVYQNGKISIQDMGFLADAYYYNQELEIEKTLSNLKKAKWLSKYLSNLQEFATTSKHPKMSAKKNSKIKGIINRYIK